jgi:hypothetical protein
MGFQSTSFMGTHPIKQHTVKLHTPHLLSSAPQLTPKRRSPLLSTLQPAAPISRKEHNTLSFHPTFTINHKTSSQPKSKTEEQCTRRISPLWKKDTRCGRLVERDLRIGYVD